MNNSKNLQHLKELEKNWKNTWNFSSRYFSEIPLLSSNKKSNLFKKKRKKKLNKIKLKRSLIDILFNIDSNEPIQLRWIYIKNKLISLNKKKDENSWEYLLNRYSGIVKNDDYLWIGAKYSKEVPII